MTKNANVSKLDLTDFIQKHNPFGVKNEDGEIQYFKTYKEAYLYVFRLLHTHFTRGYVELPLLLHELTQMKSTECTRMMHLFKSEWGKDEVRLMEYNFLCEENSFEDLRIILRTLHRLSGTQFDEEMMLQARAVFRNQLFKAQPN